MMKSFRCWLEATHKLLSLQTNLQTDDEFVDVIHVGIQFDLLDFIQLDRKRGLMRLPLDISLTFALGDKWGHSDTEPLVTGIPAFDKIAGELDDMRKGRYSATVELADLDHLIENFAWTNGIRMDRYRLQTRLFSVREEIMQLAWRIQHEA